MHHMFFLRNQRRWLVVLSLLTLGTSTCLRAAEDATGYLLVANKGEQTLAIVDPVAGMTMATIPENGVTGHEVAASPDGQRAFVPIYGNAGVGRPGTDGQLIRVIDLEKRERHGTNRSG